MSQIVLACVLTVLIETPFLALCGYRGREDLALIACTNAFSNLLLNLSFLLFLPWTPLGITAGELAVLGLEYAIYARAFGPSARVFFLTLAANALSLGLGLLLL